MKFALRYSEMVSHLMLLGSGSPLPTSTPMDRSGFETRRRLAEEGASIEEIVEKTFEFSKALTARIVFRTNPRRWRSYGKPSSETTPSLTPT